MKPAAAKKRADMTPKERAQRLHESGMYSFEEACYLEGYDAQADHRRQVLKFAKLVGLITSLVVAAAYLPDAIALVMP